MAVVPGLMDGHAHAGHSLLRTLGMHNETWYRACNDIYAQDSTEEYEEANVALLNLERLKFGTTCGISFFGSGDSAVHNHASIGSTAITIQFLMRITTKVIR